MYGDKYCVVLKVDPNSEHLVAWPDFPTVLGTFAKVNPIAAMPSHLSLLYQASISLRRIMP